MNLQLELAAILVLILLNGFFAMAEMAVVSSRRARLRHQAESGSSLHKMVLRTSERPTRFLSTIQIAITLTGALSGTLGGATIAEVLAAAYASVPALAPYAGALAIGTVVAGLTVLSVVFGELIPKRIALVNPEGIAAAVIVPVRVVSSIFAPVVFLLSGVTDLALRLLGLREKSGPSVTEEEIHVMMQQGAAEGVFEESERDMVRGILTMGGQRIGAHMTHRVDIVGIEESLPMAEVAKVVLAHPQYSQFPVYRSSLDRVTGVLVAKLFLMEYLQKREVRLRALIVKPLFLPASMGTLRALARLRDSPAGVALVMDEYGGLEGLVSMTDLQDAIFSPAVPGVSETDGAGMSLQPDGSWIVDGSLPVDDFLDLVGARGARPASAHTVAGLALEAFGCLPVSGQTAPWNGWDIRVMAMEGRRIARIQLVPRPETSGADSGKD